MHEHRKLREASNSTIKDWHEREKLALKLIKLVGDLRFDRGIEIIMFRRSIYDARPSQVIQHHKVSVNYVGTSLNIHTTHAVVQEIAAIETLGPSKIDVGTLSLEWEKEHDQFADLKEFIHNKLAENIGADKSINASRDVVLYGFGRIGRLLARRIIEFTGSGDQLRLKAIVLRSKMPDLREEVIKRMALLSEDSVHGTFHGTVDVREDGREVVINGNRVAIIFARNPTDIDYTKYGIMDALLIDNTGVWRDSEALGQHLQPGISHVLLTAPGKDIPNIVHGVNQDSVDFSDQRILSAASCTTNAIVPIIQIINSHLKIEKGHIETIHAYTSDQHLLDNFHKKPRRGRAAAVNMVLTTTGAAKAVSKVIPELEGKLTGNAVRVPTPNVSLAIISVGVEKATTVDEVNDLLREASLHGDLVEQIHYSSSTEYVSSHAVGMTTTSVLDAPSTIVSPDGKQVIIYAWYDNEYGYACQVVRLAKHVTGVRRYTYY
ncbi:MAG: glyceraldehyde-3-phosphate dehydrogenase [Bacteroidetes bacterium]|nr:MAG: glyceraldehyde-3-phosphate dehydrogenase [Bacteroidota bacterium]